MNSKLSLYRDKLLPHWVSLAITLVLLAGISLLAFSTAQSLGPPQPEAPDPPRAEGNYGGNFRFGHLEPTSLDPIDADFASFESQAGIVRQIFDGLTKWGDNLGAMPALAQSWSSSDARNWTFHIRAGAKFHNGRQVTAQDVVYSWDRLATLGNEWYDYLLAPLLDSATAVNTDTLEVTLSAPHASFPSLLALPFMAVVPSETIGTIMTSPVGSGPFQFQSWTPGDSVVVSAFADYYDGRPYLDTITYQFYGDQDAMLDGYLLGNLDFSPVPAGRFTDVVGSPNVISMTRLRMDAYWMKVDWAPFDDVQVRQALNRAVDKEDIVDNILGSFGYFVPAEGPVPPGMQGYDPPVPYYPYSPTLALDLLAQAGWTDTNNDGVLDDGAGTDLTIELWSPDSPKDQSQAEAVAEDLRDIGSTGLGATVVVSHTTWSEYLDDTPLYPFFRLGWASDYPDPYNFLYPLFHSSGWYAERTHYANPQVDTWIEDSQTVLDQTGRQNLYEDIETLIQQDAPAVVVSYMGSVFVKGDSVLGLAIPPWGADAIRMDQVQLFFDTHDVGTQTMIYPKDNVLLGPIEPAVKVRNAGSSAETNVAVRCRILDGATQVYSQTQIVPGLSSFATEIVSFPAWTPAAAGNYTFEFTTLLAGDENPANDQEVAVVTVTDVSFYDAYTQDNQTDTGSVPTAAWWQSPDIVVRNQDDHVRRHQDPVLGQTNYVYVQVENIGNDTITDGALNVYWHEPSTAVLCGDWALINPTPIPIGTLAPGERKWVQTPWVPTVEGHTCLFSRLWSADDPVTFECDVAWDNNIAQRNVEVVELGDGAVTAMEVGQAEVQFEIANVRSLPAPVDLIVERGTFPTTGTLTLELSQNLFDRWQDAGGTVSGGSVVPNSSQIEVTDPVSATVWGLPLDVREIQRAWLHLDGPPAAEFDLHVTERIEGQIVGGMTYHTALPRMIYLPLVLKNK